jgi:hypothetical protein
VNHITGSLPQHVYGRVRKYFVTNGGEADLGVTEPCIVHAISCRPGHAFTFAVLLECGAQYRGVPIHGLVLGSDLNVPVPPALPLHAHQVWGCFGTRFSLVPMTFNHNLPAQYWDHTGTPRDATGLGWAVEFDGDGYSATPHQDKSFNFLLTPEGYLVAMPNNRVRWFDSSFTDWTRPINLQVNHHTYLVEHLASLPEETALVQDTPSPYKTL